VRFVLSAYAAKDGPCVHLLLGFPPRSLAGLKGMRQCVESLAYPFALARMHARHTPVVESALPNDG